MTSLDSSSEISPIIEDRSEQKRVRCGYMLAFKACRHGLSCCVQPKWSPFCESQISVDDSDNVMSKARVWKRFKA